MFANTDTEYRVRLKGFGYHYPISSFDVMPDYHARDQERRYGELVLSRRPVRVVPSPAPDIPWPERVLSVMVSAPRGDFELHVLYVPNGSNHEEKKRDTFEGLYEGLSRHVDHPRVLCGDFCTPQLEQLEQSEHKIKIVTWAYRKEDGTFRLRPDPW